MAEQYPSYQPSGNPDHPAQPQYYGQPYSSAAREHPQGTTILVLGILGFFFAICAPFAWYLGNKALREIRSSGAHYSNEQNVVIGRILGMIVSILTIVGIVLLVLFAVIALAATRSGG